MYDEIKDIEIEQNPKASEEFNKQVQQKLKEAKTKYKENDKVRVQLQLDHSKFIDEQKQDKELQKLKQEKKQQKLLKEEKINQYTNPIFKPEQTKLPSNTDNTDIVTSHSSLFNLSKKLPQKPISNKPIQQQNKKPNKVLFFGHKPQQNIKKKPETLTEEEKKIAEQQNQQIKKNINTFKLNNNNFNNSTIKNDKQPQTQPQQQQQQQQPQQQQQLQQYNLESEQNYVEKKLSQQNLDSKQDPVPPQQLQQKEILTKKLEKINISDQNSSIQTGNIPNSPKNNTKMNINTEKNQKLQENPKQKEVKETKKPIEKMQEEAQVNKEEKIQQKKPKRLVKKAQKMQEEPENNSNQQPKNQDEDYNPEQEEKKNKKPKRQAKNTKKQQKTQENQQKNEEDEQEEEKKPKEKEKVKKIAKKPIKKNRTADPLVKHGQKKQKYQDKYRGELKRNKMQYTKNGRLKINLKQLQKLKEARDANNPNAEEQALKANKHTVFNQNQQQSMYFKCLSSALFIDIFNEDPKKPSENPENSQENPEKPSKMQEDQPENDDFSEEFLLKTAKEHFGFESFRTGQQEAIQNVLKHKNTLAVMSTGHGKSLIYQLPSILMQGLTLVISPLLSLMLDQISKLPKSLPGACINSQLTYLERMKIIDLVKQSKIKILYISPETLQSTIVYHYKDFPKINFVCIDEAHCVSEWSHNFRTTYLIIDELLQKKMNSPSILALTATATKQTQSSICQKLQIQPQNVISGISVQRGNLVLSVSREQGPEAKVALLSLLHSEKFKKLNSIIIYCMYVKTTETISIYLTQNGFPASPFNSNQDDEIKRKIQDDFMAGKIRIVVATVAFGMGIDKSNIRSVIHLNMPKTIENYVQEIGRAGRDGQPSYCHLFLQDSDYYRQKGFIYSDSVSNQLLKNLFRKLNESILNSPQISFKKSKKRSREAFEQDDIGLDQILSDLSEEERQTLMEKIEGKIYYINIKECSTHLDSKKDNLLTLMLKLQQISNNLIQIFPPTYQNCSMKFYKTSYQELQEKSDLIKEILQICRQNQGNQTFNLIEACNLLGLEPIDLIKQLREFANSDSMYCDYKEDILAFKVHKMPDLETQEDYIEKIYKEMRQYEYVQLQKIDFLYATTRINSVNTLEQSLKMTDDQLKEKTVQNYFDSYFQHQGCDYKEILKLQTNIPLQNIMPAGQLLKEQFEEIAVKVEKLIEEQTKIDSNYKNPYFDQHIQNSIVISRILQGTSSESFSFVNWKQHPLWNKYIEYNFEDVQEAVQEGINRYQLQQQQHQLE